MAETARARKTRFDGAAEPLFQRPIDLVHLAKQTLGDKGLECEVLRMFEQIVAGYLQKLRLGGSTEELTVNLQSLKGAAAGVGADAIAAHARSAERELSATGTLSEERLDDLDFVVQETSVFIAELLKEE